VIIKSFLDNDQYKFSMGQFVFHRFPDVGVEYDFNLRSKGVDLAPFADEIRAEIDKLADLYLTNSEYEFMKEKCPYFTEDYLDWLSRGGLDPKRYVHSGVDRDGKFYLTIKGRWVDTILFEVPILAIISEIWHRAGNPQLVEQGFIPIETKTDAIQNEAPDMQLLEFGTRRRNSFYEQLRVIERMRNRIPNVIKATSNMHIARILGLTPGGTMAHELFQCAQALYPITTHHEDLMAAWYEEFHPYLQCALSDTLGYKYFLTTFKHGLPMMYDGTRQDSGDPYAYADDIINYYKRHGIDPKTKYVVFSDSLDIPKAIKLHNAYKDSIGVRFGIGTNLTNDCGVVPISMVIKVQMCNNVPVVKISDSEGKTMCRDKNYMEFMKEFVRKEVNSGY
jgi:nicotinate phosphoribosyltransferase